MSLDSLEAVVSHYIENRRPEKEREFNTFSKHGELAAVAELAANRQHHPRRKHETIQQVSERLQTSDFSACNSFDALMEMLKSAIGDLDDVGLVFIYDVAICIGAKLGLRPDKVYLHAGTRKGALALGLGRRKATLRVSELPHEFHRLQPAEIEDCLNIYRRDLERIVGKSR
jgi:hypothetical protein